MPKTTPRANWRTPTATRVEVNEATDRAAWLLERRNGLGGTDAAVLMGTHVGNIKPRDVFADKLRTDAPRELNLKHFRFGHMLEPRLIAEAADAHGVEVRPGGMFRHKDEPFRYANPDALTSDDGILECKTTGADTKAAHAWRAGEVSPHAYDQAQHYLAVTGRSRARFVVGINPAGWTKLPESEWVDSVTEIIHVGPIKRDEKRIAAILEAERDFWECIKAGELSDRWAPREVEAAIPEMVEDDLRRLDLIKGQQSRLAKERESIEKRFKEEIGEEGGLLTIGGKPRARWTAYEAERFDKAALEADHPGLVEKYTTTRTQHRFSIVGGDA